MLEQVLVKRKRRLALALAPWSPSRIASHEGGVKGVRRIIAAMHAAEGYEEVTRSFAYKEGDTH